jgi:hypothetical protein
VQTLSATAFAEKVIEHGLRVVGPYQGYAYAALETDDGYDMFRTIQGTPRRFWTYTNRFTETGAAGGNNTVRITPAANTAIRIIAMEIAMCDAGGARSVAVFVDNEDNAHLAYVGTANIDNQTIDLPSLGAVVTASNAVVMKDMTIVGDGSNLYMLATALAQNEYFDVRCCCELTGGSTAPTVTHTSSGTASTGTPTQNEVTEVAPV